MKQFMLMHKNDPTAVVSMTRYGLQVDEIFNRNLLPISVRCADGQIMNNMLTIWNDTRCVPLGRPNYNSLLEKVHIQNSSDWLSYTNLCSLTDCYWFKSENSNLMWKNVNFRDNEISSNVSQYLFKEQSNTTINHLRTPDLTTNGMMPKMWEQRNGKFYLIKKAWGKDTPLTEYITSKIISTIGLKHVEYELVDRNSTIISMCENFILSDNEEFVSFDNLLIAANKTQKDAFEILSQYGFEKDVSEMLICDYLIGNVDRHAKNYGFVIDADTQSVIKMAPLFDHGGSRILENIDSATSKVGLKSFRETLRMIKGQYLDRFLKINPTNMVAWMEYDKYVTKELQRSCYEVLSKRMEQLEEIRNNC